VAVVVRGVPERSRTCEHDAVNAVDVVDYDLEVRPS